MSLSDYTIVRCNPAQTLESRRNHFVQWGQPLGFDEAGWLSRFTAMEKGEWAEDDRYVTWALVPRADPETLDLLSHCETFRRQAIIKTSGAKAAETISYGIASVYTPARHRGKGYARHILQLVHYLIAPSSILPPFPSAWGAQPHIGPKDASFSILFSGIGDKYYATCRQGAGPESKTGWIRQPVTSRTWDVTKVSTETLDSTGWNWLGADELGDLEARAAAEMKQKATKDEPDAGCSFIVLPTWSLLSIHAKRSELSPVTKGVAPRPYGLSLPPTSYGGLESFATFTYPEGVTDEPTLRVTYLHGPVPFEAIAAAAQRAGCSKVSMWGGRAAWDDRNPELDTESEMPCYVVYGQDTEQSTWLEPEYYTWC